MHGAQPLLQTLAASLLVSDLDLWGELYKVRLYVHTLVLPAQADARIGRSVYRINWTV